MNSNGEKRRPREASSIGTVMSEECHNLIESKRGNMTMPERLPLIDQAQDEEVDNTNLHLG
jgi:hypothetical protein